MIAANIYTVWAGWPPPPPPLLLLLMMMMGIVCCSPSRARTLLVEDFASRHKVNEFGFDSTDDGTASVFLKRNNRLTLQVSNPDQYFRCTLDERHLCFDASAYTHVRFRVWASPDTHISVTLKEGNAACRGPSLYPEFAAQRMVMVHRFVSGGRFTGSPRGQLVEIPLDRFEGLEFKRIAEIFFNGIHTVGRTGNMHRTRIQLARLELTDTPTRKGDAPRSLRQAEYVTNCKPGTFAFTFDGPSNNLPRIMNVLEKYDAKATFFIRGETVEEQPELVSVLKDAHERGHQLESHTWSHPSFTAFDYDHEFLRRELSRTSHLIHEITGKRTRMFRPPYGHINADNLHLLHQNGYTHSVHWNLDSMDVYLAESQPEKILQTILNKIKLMEPHNSGGLLLLHDYLDASADAVEPILRAAKKKGYKFVSVDDCLGAIGSTGHESGASLHADVSLAFHTLVLLLLSLTMPWH